MPSCGSSGRWLARLADDGGDVIAFGTLRADTLAQRDRLLALLAGFYSGSRSGVAKAIARDVRRYASDCWPRLRHDFAPPAHHEREQVLFALHRKSE